MDFLKKACKLKKYWLVPSFLILLEAGMGMYSLIKHKSFFDMNKYIIEKAKPSIVYNAKFIPLLAKYHLGIGQVGEELIEKAAKNPKTIQRAKRLFRKDILNRYSEIGGIATLVWEKNECYIKFYEIKNKNEDFANKLDRVRCTGNCENVIKTIEENDDFFVSLMRIDKSEFEPRIKLIREMRGRIKRMYLSDLVDDIIQKSDSLDMFSPENAVDFYYKTNINGKYIGDFHTHNDATEPSKTDLKASYFNRQLILSLYKDGFKIYDLIKGSCRKTDVFVKGEWVNFRNYYYVKH